jgi:hypothetical protein
MLALFEAIRRIARAPGPVLITGESGTGKELVARALHAESERAERPVRGHQLRGHSHGAAGVGTVRSCRRRLQRCHRCAQGPVRRGPRRQPAAGRDRRDAARHAGQAAAPAPGRAGAPGGRQPGGGGGRADSGRHQPGPGPHDPRTAVFARTSSTAWRPSTSPCRPCGSAARTWSVWPCSSSSGPPPPGPGHPRHHPGGPAPPASLRLSRQRARTVEHPGAGGDLLPGGRNRGGGSAGAGARRPRPPPRRGEPLWGDPRPCPPWPRWRIATSATCWSGWAETSARPQRCWASAGAPCIGDSGRT